MAKTVNQIIWEVQCSNINYCLEEVVEIVKYAYQQGRESTIEKPIVDPKFEEVFKDE